MSVKTWLDWIKDWQLEALYGVDTDSTNDRGVKELPIDASFVAEPIQFTEQDRLLAWRLYQEMHTRMVARERGRSGAEKAALNSVNQLFSVSEEQIKEIGPGCINVATLFNHVLNGRVERFSSKWRRRMEDGQFENTDSCRVFRLEIFKLQQDLRRFKDAFKQIASKKNTHGLPLDKQDEAVRSKNVYGTQQALTKVTNSVAQEYQAEALSGWPSTTEQQRRRLLEAIDCPLESKFVPSKITEFPAIEKAENAQLRQRRAALNVASDDMQVKDVPPKDVAPESGARIDDAVGLCFSGGGIRASTFAMGVTQRLAEQGVFKYVDYLSTVSGGGYFGSFLSSYLDSGNPEVGSCRDTYPFGTSERSNCGNGSGASSAALVGRDESNALRHIRNRASYLTWGAWYKFQIFGLMVFGVLVNLLMIFPLVTFAVILTKLVLAPAFTGIMVPDADVSAANIKVPEFPYFADSWYWLGLLTLGFGGFLTLVRTLLRGNEKYKFWWWINHTYGWTTRILFALFLLVTVVNFLPFLSFLKLKIPIWIDHLVTLPKFEKSFNQAIGSIVSAAIVPFVLRLLSGTGASSSLSAKIFRVLFILSGPLFFLFSYLVMVEQFIVQTEDTISTWSVWGWTIQEPTLYVLLFAIPLFLGAVVLNINFASPHMFYRDSLCNTFLLRPEDKFEDCKDTFENIDVKKLSDLRSHRPELPYHLINAVINAPASKEPNLRGRDSDFYVFSQCFCGSPLIGYTPTKTIERLDAHVNLGTAMAISGAAASPHSGALTDKSSVFLLTLLNVRLGYWLRNPKRNLMERLNRLWHPNSFYLLFEMFGLITDKFSVLGFDYPPAFHNLSDGGHLENLGAYELLRRRCKFIIAVDGEADPGMHCASMMKLIRYARIDFGVEIHFDPKEFENQDTGHAKSHFALGVIDYGKANSNPQCRRRELGIIIYLKNNLTGNESPDILEYHQRHPDFPHVHIKDQFFDEEQFEAFRALGYHVADEAMGSQIFDGFVPEDLSVKDWAEQLVRKLYQN